MAKLSAHLLISGRVQGVFYRHSLRTLAERLSICGWVRNLPDGRVEAYLEGEETDIEELIKWAKKGPPLAEVTEVKVSYEKSLKGFRDFQILF